MFDHRDGDVFGCVADVGWITGHSYVVYGPLSNGATTVLFESTPVYPNPGEIHDHDTATVTYRAHRRNRTTSVRLEESVWLQLCYSLMTCWFITCS